MIKRELSLVNLKALIIEKNTVNLSSLAKNFQEDPVLIQQMLAYFIKKGQLVEKRLTPHCGTSCQSCPVSDTVVYQWQTHD